ncbi:MAG: DUF1801 domain-containing protein [Chitinophagaceae bacterium]|nr:DUF1801 domain-containing protein [Chitinophagaceae bacterium]
MADLKTKENESSVTEFLNTVDDKVKRQDCYALVELMKQITKAEPKMWGTSIVGFGTYHYKYDSGHQGDAVLVGFSPRKQNITIYLMGGFVGDEDMMNKLGKFKTGKSCLYIKSLNDVDKKCLGKLIETSVKKIKQRAELIKQKEK